jgi:hypothetical protein
MRLEHDIEFVELAEDSREFLGATEQSLDLVATPARRRHA